MIELVCEYLQVKLDFGLNLTEYKIITPPKTPTILEKLLVLCYTSSVISHNNL